MHCAFPLYKRIIPKQVLLIILAVIVVGESGATAYIGVKTTTVTGTFDYPRGEENTASVIEYMDNLEKIPRKCGVPK